MKELKKLGRFIRPYRKEIVIALLLMVVISGLELYAPRLIEVIIDKGVTAGNMTVVWQTALLMLGIAIFSVFISIFRVRISVHAQEGFAKDLRSALYQKVQSFSFANLDQLRTGELIVRLTSDVTQTKMAFQVILGMVARAVAMFVVSLVMMISISPSLTLKVLPFMFLIVLTIVLVVSKVQAIVLLVQKKLENLNNVMQENLAGIRVVKAFVRDEHEKKRFDFANIEYRDLTIKVSQIMSFIFPFMFFILNISGVSVIYFGGIDTINGSMSVGQIMAFSNYIMTVMFPILMLSMGLAMLASSTASAKRIDEVLSARVLLENPSAGYVPEKINGQVEFRDVCFEYNVGGEADMVLQGFNFTAYPGRRIAILGATGSGKSTMVKLIPRFYDVCDGQVLIDDVNVKEYDLDYLSKHIGVVLQEAVLFSGTIRENIAFGKPDATEEEVMAAAKAAQAHDFIMSFEKGYDTEVVQRGANLSGGQKQRISIARALLMQPEILIFDDSTSAVDVETETKIESALNELMQNTTTFIIAQRISTVLSADVIIVLDDGKIVAMGRHEELIESSKIYQEIYDSQLGGVDDKYLDGGLD